MAKNTDQKLKTKKMTISNKQQNKKKKELLIIQKH